MSLAAVNGTSVPRGAADAVAFPAVVAPVVPAAGADASAGALVAAGPDDEHAADTLERQNTGGNE
jgi:hypothetical protein